MRGAPYINRAGLADGRTRSYAAGRDGRMTDQRHAAHEQVEERISRELARVHEESYGVPPRNVRTHVLDDAVLCVIDIDLLPHERTLLAGGHGTESIIAVRSDFQRSFRSTFIAAVEHSTGRRVSGFISDTHLDPPFTVEFFRLAAKSESRDDPTDVGETSTA
jgi:uncharacterized protein YbcI